MNAEREIFINSFPPSLTSDVNSCLDKLDLFTSIKSSGYFQIILEGHTLNIPYRIYYDVPVEQGLTETESFLLDCMFTRHYNGFVREERLRRIIMSDDYLATPFIMQLLGEYVIDILNVIKENLSPAKLDNIVRMKVDNPKFFKITEDRVQSYWNCYYKWYFPKKSDYVGFQILDEIGGRRSSRTLSK